MVTLCCSLIGPGKQLVQYTPVMTEPISLEGGGADLPSLLELGEEPFFSSDLPTDEVAADLLSHARLDTGLWCYGVIGNHRNNKTV